VVKKASLDRTEIADYNSSLKNSIIKLKTMNLHYFFILQKSSSALLPNPNSNPNWIGTPENEIQNIHF